jgi:very-short-patch-repair endonuclease
MTQTEVRLWILLKGRRLDGWKFRRQVPIGPYIVDFYCPGAKLVVELDGASHDSQEKDEEDNERQAWLEAKGYKVLRFSSDNPEGDYLEGVWTTIQGALDEVSASVALRAVSPRGWREWVE